MEPTLRQVAVCIAGKGYEPHLRAGEPFLYEEPSMELLEEQSTFLRKHFVLSGKRSSPETWKAAAYQLKTWLEFLAAQDIPWHLANADDLISYKEALYREHSPHSGKRYDPKTIRNYMLTVISFYRFAAEESWYSGALGDATQAERQLTPIDRNALAHTQKGSRSYTRSVVRDLVPKAARHHNQIRPFSVREWRALTKVLGPYPSEKQRKHRRPSRDRLVCEVAFWTGLRLSEVEGLTANQFLSISTDGASRASYSRLYISKGTTKGSIARVIRIPNWLVEEVKLYIRGERARLIRQGRRLLRQRGRRPTAPTQQLFVTSADANLPGEALGKRRIQGIITAACLAAGLTKIEQRLDATTGVSHDVTVSAHSFHDLRHSYAVWTYWGERRRGNQEPWKLIQAQLGHQHLTTTTDTYLHYVEIFDGSDIVVDIRELLDL